MKIKILLGLLLLSLTSYVLANDGDSDKNDEKDYVVLALSTDLRTFQYMGYPNVTFFVNVSPKADQFTELSELGNIKFYKIPKHLLDNYKLEGLVSIGENLNANQKTVFTIPLKKIFEPGSKEQTIAYTLPGKFFSSTYRIRFRPQQQNITMGGNTFPIIYFSIVDIRETQIPTRHNL